MKLIIQIPCYNEEATLAVTLADLPRSVKGFSEVEWLVIDDGSTDRTSEVAKKAGVSHIIRHPANMGLARAYMSGLAFAVEAGADVIVNTDADNQYCGKSIPDLVEPIVEGRAEMVIGARPISQIEDFSQLKKFLQKFGSYIVRLLSQTDVVDAPSGFRAITRDVAMRLNVFTEYTYTLETIIQAGRNGIQIVSVPVSVNPQTRPSRLVKSALSYVKRSVITMLRIFITYKPMRFFLTIGTALFIAGIAIGIRFLIFYLAGEGTGKVQSLILAALLIGGGIQMYVVGIMSDLLAVNRKLLQDLSYRLKRIEYSKSEFRTKR